MVTFVIILSKAFGFVRDIVTTAEFGLSMQNDAYVAAYSLFYVPVLLFNSCISATMIPLYTEAREHRGLKRANRFASNSINIFAMAAILISVIMCLLSEPIVRLVYHGFEPGKSGLTAELTRIMLFGLVFNVTSISLASLLNAGEEFIGAQLTGFPLSLCVILATYLFSPKYGIKALAWGVFIANALQMLILIPFLKGWFRYSLVLNLKDKRVHRLMRLAVPALLSMGVSELNHMIDHALASVLQEGTMTAMSSAYRLITFLQGIMIVPLITIMFSKMSRKVAQGDEPGACRMLMRSMLELALVVLPVVAIGVVLSRDVIKFAYMRGHFKPEDVPRTAGIMSFYLIGLPAFGMRDFMNRLFHAMKDTRSPFYVSLAVVSVNIAGNLILRRLMGANGLALATSIAGYTGSMILIALLLKRFGDLGVRGIVVDLVKILLAVTVSAGACFILDGVLPQAHSTIQTFGRLVVCAGVSFIIYGITCMLLKINTVKQLLVTIRER